MPGWDGAENGNSNSLLPLLLQRPHPQPHSHTLADGLPGTQLFVSHLRGTVLEIRSSPISPEPQPLIRSTLFLLLSPLVSFFFFSLAQEGGRQTESWSPSDIIETLFFPFGTGSYSIAQVVQVPQVVGLVSNSWLSSCLSFSSDRITGLSCCALWVLEVGGFWDNGR